MKSKIVSKFIIGTFVTLYVIVSLISTIHVIEFFRLSNPEWLAISLAIAFEIGAAASLASLIILKKMNKTLIWTLFIILTLIQAMGNTYYSFMHLENFTGWIELFDMADEELLYQKRVLSIISGAILPLIALGFIKSLVDYIKPEENLEKIDDSNIKDNKKSHEVTSDELLEDELTIDEIVEDERRDDEKTEEISEYLEVDGGNSSTMESGTIMSPDHYSDISYMDNTNTSNGKEVIKRYPENLE